MTGFGASTGVRADAHDPQFSSAFVNMQIAYVKAEVAKSQGMDAEKMVLIYQGKVRIY